MNYIRKNLWMTISHYNNYKRIISNYYERVRDKGSRIEREVRGIKITEKQY